MREQAYCVVHTATIASGAPGSSAIPYGGFRSGVFIMPAAFTGASVSFKVSQDGTTWTALYAAANTLISITIGVDRAYPFPAEAQGAKFIQILSASNEDANRSLVCMLKS